MRISDWSSDVCSSDLPHRGPARSGSLSALPIAAAYELLANDPPRSAQHEIGQRLHTHGQLTFDCIDADAQMLGGLPCVQSLDLPQQDDLLDRKSTRLNSRH